jgi:hypothetical protein
MGGLAAEWNIRPWEIDQLTYSQFCAFETAIQESAFEAEKQKRQAITKTG